MKIELIPVIEVGYNNHASLQAAGFKDEFKPYFNGYQFYEPKEVTDSNLRKLVLDFTKVFREYNRTERESHNPFYGGYVLKINQEDKFFPQCCGDLGDIKYWENVSNGINSHCEGHPRPKLKFESNKVTFDFTLSDYEDFEPEPLEKILEIELNELKLAVDKAKIELNKLAKRVIAINKILDLKIDKIDDLLIWENPKYD